MHHILNGVGRCFFAYGGLLLSLLHLHCNFILQNRGWTM